MCLSENKTIDYKPLSSVEKKKYIYVFESQMSKEFLTQKRSEDFNRTVENGLIFVYLNSDKN